MANEKQLIDVERRKRVLERFYEHMVEFGNVEAAKATRAIINGLKIEPIVDAVEVVRCENCVSHGKCFFEGALYVLGYEKPFCCAGKIGGDGNA